MRKCGITYKEKEAISLVVQVQKREFVIMFCLIDFTLEECNILNVEQN